VRKRKRGEGQMTATSVLLLCVFSLLSLSLSQTTPFIQEVFLGKCYQKNPTGNVLCQNLWTAFSQAAQINNYNVNTIDYLPFFEIANFSSPTNRAMMWDGSLGNAMIFTEQGNNQYTSVETTSTGFILSNMNWCGTSNNTFDYNNKCEYANNVTTSYFGMEGVWNLCAQYFAQGVSGHLTILLQPSQLNINGSYLAYRNSSMLGASLRNITVTKVTGVTILLMTNLTAAPYEVCSNGSLLNLTQSLASYGLNWKCIDDQEVIYKTLCPSGANTPQCLSALLAQSTNMPKKEKEFLAWALVTSVLTAALFVLTVYFGLRVRVLESELRI